ncbi:cupin domain-containing protein [Novosphingobium album (ex Liu et al. 2023)]|uniref:Cupin domain-containing protein n=1 Tax=Novosphingobium album (ex Liu et al. 2023) TaxID=3031130 RepID=A0ABT5WXA2_9SPHN|nr:hypothetical protein [Novosphingobium album (ex Liu et al. 2023)]MDE8654502.1 hypothetical protein [Novosphingobium album (ex Liu et al. 2023)]
MARPAGAGACRPDPARLKMGKVVTARIGATPPGEFPALAGIRAQGALRSEAVIGGPDRPLALWVHRMPDGASIALADAPVDHLFFVLDGALDSAAQNDAAWIARGGSALVAHGAKALLRAVGGATIAHFHRRQDHPVRPAGPGGTAGFVPDGSPQGWDQRTGMLYRIFHDSRDPASDAWFHRTDFPEGHKGVPHLHTTDEIILVLDGEMRVGTRSHPAGTALAIDANTVYSFAAGSPSLAFVNFRAEHSERIGVTRQGRTPPMEEADFLRSLPPAPPGGWAALRAPTAQERAGDGGAHYLDVAGP